MKICWWGPLLTEIFSGGGNKQIFGYWDESPHPPCRENPVYSIGNKCNNEFHTDINKSSFRPFLGYIFGLRRNKIIEGHLYILNHF